VIITAGRQGEQTLLARAMGRDSQHAQYAQLVSAGGWQRAGTARPLEAHRADVAAKLAEMQECLRLIDHKIDVYRGRVAAGDADRLWATTR
jgi:hypothetical protein